VAGFLHRYVAPMTRVFRAASTTLTSSVITDGPLIFGTRPIWTDGRRHAAQRRHGHVRNRPVLDKLGPPAHKLAFPGFVQASSSGRCFRTILPHAAHLRLPPGVHPRPDYRQPAPEIHAAGFAIEPRRLVTETVSGSVAAVQRRGFARLLDRLEAGDVLVVTKLDRLGRNAITSARRWPGSPTSACGSTAWRWAGST
jgi:hypothetical protein